jgi:hypothetical protein
MVAMSIIINETIHAELVRVYKISHVIRLLHQMER